MRILLVVLYYYYYYYFGWRIGRWWWGRMMDDGWVHTSLRSSTGSLARFAGFVSVVLVLFMDMSMLVLVDFLCVSGYIYMRTGRGFRLWKFRDGELLRINVQTEGSQSYRWRTRYSPWRPRRLRRRVCRLWCWTSLRWWDGWVKCSCEICWEMGVWFLYRVVGVSK